jgi:hypothetical protein
MSTGLEEEVTVKGQKEKKPQGHWDRRGAPMNNAYFRRDLRCFPMPCPPKVLLGAIFFIPHTNISAILYN